MPSSPPYSPSAYPTLPEHHGYRRDQSSQGTPAGPGMTLREYYAGLFLAAILANPGWIGSVEHRTITAVRRADALIAELAK